MLKTGHLLLFIFCLITISLLIWMLFPIRIASPPPPKKPKGHCPLCGHALYAGEKVRSSQTEIGDVQVQTRIRGCIYCVEPEDKSPRNCPICKREVPKGDFILATSDPRLDRLKLSIKGCKWCFPQGF